ncbi:hypothetical protein [Paucisalibacillus globulus]|uniref:hypothetical protein n=1 Tax=Paucisalibacillus globulus TaxID=351095 RepID=UPI00040AE85F|nr:hypothetical protein [Paucisalibacillus globulus]
MLHAVILEETTNYEYPDYDGLWKNLISLMFEDFILFFAPELYEEIDFSKSPYFIQQEHFQDVLFSKQNRRMADQLVKAPLINGKEKWILIHIEVQDNANDEFRKRMFHYFYRIYDRYDHEIYAIALLTNSNRHPKQDYYDYHYYSTSLIYKYNVFNFKEQNTEKLKNSSNPFAAAVLAGIYASQAKGNDLKKYTFKRNLMIQALKRFTPEKEKSRQYLSALFHFIDYVIQTPETLEQRLKDDIKEYIKEAIKVNIEKVKISPTWECVLEDLEKEWSKEALLKGRAEGKLEASYEFSRKLLQGNYPVDEIIKLTGLTMQDIQSLKDKKV